MRPEFANIQERILSVAIGALTQANTHSAFSDPGMEHWSEMSILNAAQTGELFLKAIIAKEHPLLIFRDLFDLNDPSGQELSIDSLIKRGKTYGLEHLPKLLWVTTGERLPHMESFDRIRKARNAIQHFCAPDDETNLQGLSLEFLYRNIDPLINKHFGLFAIEYHEDRIQQYDYLVSCIIRSELHFSIPDNFLLTEIDVNDELLGCTTKYQKELRKRFEKQGIKLTRRS